ncbi:hypothetical protein [Chitiniphilus shinanonensis]|uniref:hypothetical protein n=1 Tax=Chitiniphilus shinanonensis TaxID=553088 RepID=UPI0003717B0D|nr:hypothetical protein [Chitiniphilus shinanonensis]
MSRLRGAALLLLLMALLLATTTLWLHGPLRSHAAQRAIEHDSAVLAQAKSALLAWAALHCAAIDDAAEAARVRSGELPVPDRHGPGHPGFGVQDANGASLGRLPWRTLGLPPLRDASGEPLWYAVADRYRDNGTGSLAEPCTDGLVVSPAPPVAGDCVIAVVLAPGAPRPGQQRDEAADASAYLESAVVDGRRFDNAARQGPFLAGPWPAGDAIQVNDRLVALSWRELAQSGLAQPCSAP